MSDPALVAESRSRSNRAKPVYMPHDPLLDAREAAAERGTALSTFWRDVKAGTAPAPYYPSPRCPRWRRSEIHAAVQATRRPRSAA
jgi:predicted DNA-binding transcriptional regulator AlpA